jgi:hypothetical protein
MGVLIYSYIAVVCREPPLLADKAQLFKLRHKCTETYVKNAKKRGNLTDAPYFFLYCIIYEG